jgi:hypothetical protein
MSKRKHDAFPHGLTELVRTRYDGWFRAFRFEQAWNGLVGGTAIILSSLVAGKVFPALTTYLSVGAAICTSLVAFYGFKDRASAYQAAWRALDLAIIDYDREPSDQARQAIYEAIRAGESMIRVADH